MLPRRAVTVPASLIFSFRTIGTSISQLIGDESPPKPPGNAFVQFVKENYHREIETGNNLKEQMKGLKCIWKSMSPNKQQPYEIMYRVKKVHFIEDKEKFFGSFTPDEDIEDMKNHALGKLPGEVLFMLEKLHSIDFDDMPRSMPSYNKKCSEAAAEWNKLSDDQKKPYVDEAELINRSKFLDYCIENPEYLLEVEKAIAKRK